MPLESGKEKKKVNDSLTHSSFLAAECFFVEAYVASAVDGTVPSADQGLVRWEKIDLLGLRRLTFQLEIAQPANIVRQYFDARRGMEYRGMVVTHISRTCPDLWKVRACIHSPPFVFFSQHRILQEGSHSLVYQAFSDIIIPF